MSIFSSATSPIMAKAFAAFALVMFTALGLMYWQLTLKDNKIAEQAESIGAKEAQNAQLRQTIIDTESENKKLKQLNKISEDTIYNNRIVIDELMKDDKLHRIQIDRLKKENEEINAYANATAPIDVISLFRKPPCEAGDDNTKGICTTTEGVTKIDPNAVYPTESIIFYALDLETALDSCNADKASLRDFYTKVEAMNDG